MISKETIAEILEVLEPFDGMGRAICTPMGRELQDAIDSSHHIPGSGFTETIINHPKCTDYVKAHRLAERLRALIANSEPNPT